MKLEKMYFSEISKNIILLQCIVKFMSWENKKIELLEKLIKTLLWQRFLRQVSGTVLSKFTYNLLACSRGTTPEPVNRTVSSMPPTLTVPGAANRERNESHRKSQPVHRASTGGIMDEIDSPRTPSPTKSKLNFLEGFKNTLRARSPIRLGTLPVSGDCQATMKFLWKINLIIIAA